MNLRINISNQEIIEAKEIVFVFSGNIIRSAFAELLAKSQINSINFSSFGTEYFNNNILYETRVALLSKGISQKRVDNFKPTHITQIKEYDLNTTLFFAMTNKHLKDINNFFGNKVKANLLLNLIDEDVEVEDPYFTGNFEKVFTKIEECIYQLEKYLNE